MSEFITYITACWLVFIVVYGVYKLWLTACNAHKFINGSDDE